MTSATLLLAALLNASQRFSTHHASTQPCAKRRLTAVTNMIRLTTTEGLTNE